MPCMKTRGLEEEPAGDVVTSLAQVVLPLVASLSADFQYCVFLHKFLKVE